MIRTTVKRRLVNPQRRRKAAAKKRTTTFRARRAKRTARKKNPGQLITLGLLNPQKRRTHVSKKRTKKHARRSVRKAANPFKFRARVKRSFRRRRNPGIVGRSTGMIKTALIVLIGLVLTRQLPQIILKEKNTGWMGYAANALTAMLGGAAATKFMGKEAGQFMAIGGSAYLLNRVLTEKFSPIGSMLSLSGVGDYAATGALGGLGEVVPKFSPVPVNYNADGTPDYNPYLLEAARAGMAPAAPAPAKAMGAWGRGW